MSISYLSIGSNMGDKKKYLNFSIDQLKNTPQITSVKASSFYQTQPVGGVVQDDYINAVLVIETKLSPEQLLLVTSAIEQKADRKRTIHWGPRTLDIDILLFDKQKITTKTLTIPHPEMGNRRFVLIPLLEILENDDPTNQLDNIRELLDKTNDRNTVEIINEENK